MMNDVRIDRCPNPRTEGCFGSMSAISHSCTKLFSILFTVVSIFGWIRSSLLELERLMVATRDSFEGDTNDSGFSHIPKGCSDMDFTRYESHMGEARKQRVSRSRKKRREIEGESSQREAPAVGDSGALTDEVPTAPPTHLQAQVEAIFHEPTRSASALRRAVHAEDFMQAQCTLPDALSAKIRHTSYQLATMALAQEEKVAEKYRQTLDAREKYVLAQNQLHETELREQALKAEIDRLRREEIPAREATAAASASRTAVKKYKDSNQFVIDTSKAYRVGFRRCRDQVRTKHPEIPLDGVSSHDYGEESPESAEDLEEDEEGEEEKEAGEGSKAN
ncbi:uncharacterized protein LOC131146940 isoform X2 [Malania oleifera]|uniref:uncharacterized protein LOC131146940 isoform X2 n=1 Tax=Malania oleifera TaxID=397392 RepID=UPI0025AE9867|nr:uncharacterized protein LOC131146940 isoform X2 [Malania oleifera]